MSESDAGTEPSQPSDAPEESIEASAEDGAEAQQTEPETQAPVVTAPEAGRTELKAQRARKTLEEEAELARRRVLGARRGRLRPASIQTSAADREMDTSEDLRQLVRGLEEETERLQEDVFRLRSAAGRAGVTLHEEIQRAADELAQDAVEQLESTVGQTAAESLETLTAALEALQETATSLQNAANSLDGSVEKLKMVAPAAEHLADLAAAPPSIPDALAGILRDLTDQLAALGDAVSTQVRTSVEDVLAAELGRHEARMEHALARLVDEMARLRRRLPVTKKGAAIDLTKEQLTGIGEAVGDYLLAAMREQKA